MKRYFKKAAESDLGEGRAYLELTDNWPSRQVELYGEQVRWADVAHPEWLADQPFSALGLTPEDEIGEPEFEAVWVLRRP